MYKPPWDISRAQSEAEVATKRNAPTPSNNSRKNRGKGKNHQKPSRNASLPEPKAENAPLFRTLHNETTAKGKIRRNQQPYVTKMKFREDGPFGTGGLLRRSRSNSNSDSNSERDTRTVNHSVARARFQQEINETRPFRKLLSMKYLRESLDTQRMSDNDIGSAQQSRYTVSKVRQSPFTIKQSIAPLQLNCPKEKNEVKRNIEGLSPEQIRQREQQRPGSPATHAFSTLTKTARYTGFGDNARKDRPKSAPSTRAAPVFGPPKMRKDPLSASELDQAIAAAESRARAHLPMTLESRIVKHKRAIIQTAIVEGKTSIHTLAASSIDSNGILGWRREAADRQLAAPKHAYRYEQEQQSCKDNQSGHARKNNDSLKESISGGGVVSGIERTEVIVRSIQGAHGYNAYSSNNRSIELWSTAAPRDDKISPGRIKRGIPLKRDKSISPGIANLNQNVEGTSREQAKADDALSPERNIMKSKSQSGGFSPIKQPSWWVRGMPVTRIDVSNSSAASLASRDVDSITIISAAEELDWAAENHGNHDSASPTLEVQADEIKELTNTELLQDCCKDVIDATESPEKSVVHGGDMFNSEIVTQSLLKQKSIQIEEYLGDDEDEAKAVLLKHQMRHQDQSHMHVDHFAGK